MKKYLTRRNVVGGGLLAFCLFVVVNVALAQTGVGFIKFGLFNRIHVSQDSGQYAGLSIVQQGDGHAIDVLDTNSLVAAYFVNDGSLFAPAITVTQSISTPGDITIGDDLTVLDDALIGGDLDVTNDVRIVGTLDVTRAVTFQDDLLVAGNITQGDGTPDITQDGEDAYIEGTLEVDGAARFDANVDLNGSDLIIDTDGDSILQEATDDNVTLTLGAAGGTFSVLTGNFKVGNGTPAVAQDGEDAYIEGVLEVGELAYFPDYDGAPVGGIVFGNDLDAAIGWANASDSLAINTRVNCQPGDQCSLWYSTVTTGTLGVLYGNLTIGDGTPTWDLDGEDAYIEGTLEVDGDTYWDGQAHFVEDVMLENDLIVTGSLTVTNPTVLQNTLDVDGITTFNEDTTVVSNFTVSATTTLNGDATVLPESSGGNQGAKNEYIGLPRITMLGLGAGTNGTTETTSYVDDSPTGEYAPIDANVTEAEGSGDSIYKYGASSYKARFDEDASADDGFKRTIAGDDLEANESIGLLLYPSVAIASGDLQILLTDDGGARNYNIGALTANKWNWVEVDISGLAAGTGDTITEFGVTLTAQGEAALGAFDLYLDIAYKWDSTDEEALGLALQQDGVLSILAAPTAGGAHSVLAELTDFVVHYESGNDFLVWITDQSANTNVALVAY